MPTSGRISSAYRKSHMQGQRRAAFDGGVPYTEPVRVTAHPIRIRRTRVAVLLVAAAAIAATLGYQLLASSTAFSSSTAPSSLTASPSSKVAPRDDVRRSAHHGALGEADGAVPGDTTVFDDGVPAVANLDPALLGALRQAATDASRDGGEFIVNSGWRSPAYQEQLRREAIAKYGSAAEAARWVAAPNTSAHVSGDAVDIGPSGAAAWLSEHGAAYGLCQIYANEPWHYELRSDAGDHGCPAMYADPTHDPRMQQ
jgi:zinc D-Ala-D-Ala carboxypeptidase